MLSKNEYFTTKIYGLKSCKKLNSQKLQNVINYNIQIQLIRSRRYRIKKTKYNTT